MPGCADIRQSESTNSWDSTTIQYTPSSILFDHTISPQFVDRHVRQYEQGIWQMTTESDKIPQVVGPSLMIFDHQRCVVSVTKVSFTGLSKQGIFWFRLLVDRDSLGWEMIFILTPFVRSNVSLSLAFNLFTPSICVGPFPRAKWQGFYEGKLMVLANVRSSCIISTKFVVRCKRVFHLNTGHRFILLREVQYGLSSTYQVYACNFDCSFRVTVSSICSPCVLIIRPTRPFPSYRDRTACL